MKCPCCRSALIALETDGVEVDWCAACQGVWLDQGELKLLHTDTRAAQEFVSGLKKADGSRHAAEHRRAGRKCPICRARLEAVGSAWDPSIVVDRCPNHDGLWFDRGELMQVLRMRAPTDRVQHFLSGIFSAN